ncbi:hypothetical protein [Plasticicumulans acidivorans]|uniref:Uncharacterized protein n=1 Tax=Plasticicumulans acidivorans TaxID=886464 RepID=A0A317N1J0_9GAMM|nr:hypothetical protein [Plasticicumulans acidivorans]PWV65994.1 hypothetical protein C7443_101482 [Plasticicumulans acidivorans]
MSVLGSLRAGGSADLTGDGALAGTLYLGNPPQPGLGRVRVLDADSGRVAREVWSDAATGAYQITGLATDREWIVLGTDPTGVQDAAVHDRRRAELPT